MFYVGGIVGNIFEENKLIVKFDGCVEIEDFKIVKGEDNEGKVIDIVIFRILEVKLVDVEIGIILSINNIFYGFFIFVKNG